MKALVWFHLLSHPSVAGRCRNLARLKYNHLEVTLMWLFSIHLLNCVSVSKLSLPAKVLRHAKPRSLVFAWLSQGFLGWI